MSVQERLAEVFVELTDTMVDDFDIVEFLTTLAHRCAELLHAADAGVMIADEHGSLRAVASSSEAARLLDLFELQNDEGPCLDCYRSGAQVLNQSLAEPDRWAAFSPEARRLGYGLVHAVPMRLRDRTIGAVNIFTTADAGLTPAEVSLAQALADVATIALLQERGLREARQLSEQLQAALQTRVVIEQAKGMLAERTGLEMDEAFDLLRQHARRTNGKLGAVAQALLDGRLAVSDMDRS